MTKEEALSEITTSVLQKTNPRAGRCYCRAGYRICNECKTMRIDIAEAVSKAYELGFYDMIYKLGLAHRDWPPTSWQVDS